MCGTCGIACRAHLSRVSTYIQENVYLRTTICVLLGGILGMMIGWCTNAAMVEISINAIFALYFGFFFLFLAGVIGWRVYNFVNASNRYALLGLSGLMGLAGLICVFYQRYWFFSLSAGFRVPIYAVLGVSLSFALSFAMAELLNYASTQSAGIVGGGVAPRAQHALVQSPQQIFLLATSSVALGFVYGIIFGFAEIGKGVFTLHTLRTQFLHEERICLPIGALVGAITAVLNDRWSAAGSAAAGGRSDKGHERSGGGAAGAGGLGAFGDPLGGSSSSSSGGSAASHGGGIGAGGGSSGGGIGIPIDTGGPNDPNAFASSDADAIEDAFDPFPTNAKTKY